MTTVDTVVDSVRDLHFDDVSDLTKPSAFDTMRALIVMGNLLEHRMATVAGHLDRLGVAKDHGRKMTELLIVMGLAPAFAARLQRVAAASSSLPTLHAHAIDGAISGEHVDAIVKGMTHAASRCAEPIDDATRLTFVTDLLGQFFSGATSAQIAKHARTLGNQHADDTGGIPAAEDRDLNALSKSIDNDGRLEVRADLNVEVGEKFHAAIEELAKPRLEPDGSPDARSTERRQADALETLLDIAARGGNTHIASAPRTQTLITVPAQRPTQAESEFMGSITEATLHTLTCDGTITTMIVDGEKVPLDISREKRLFPAPIRRALHERDKCCIKCGAPASRTHAHHLHHWADGGETCLENGCLLCPSCHADVHHNGWDVVMGLDRHPWLIPPTTVDSRRQPIPAHNRRTLNLDNPPAAA
ncbi:HNH endonuclease [Gordonia sp. SL306]|uniref:HNH endonuclease n=1 Tax=Gordonia sp. SL306 TaxID=2995145 RepID=UPI00226DDC29|nr:HNH endonuclease signature motif containing protein [Gordonia sp. SL306]WAC53982.1 DUF222 domain-containing protein [Gordonia sp. SL306]